MSEFEQGEGAQDNPETSPEQQMPPESDLSSKQKKMHPGTKLTMVALVLIFGLIAVGAWYGSIRPTAEAEPVPTPRFDAGQEIMMQDADRDRANQSGRSSSDASKDRSERDETTIDDPTFETSMLEEFWQVNGRVPDPMFFSAGGSDSSLKSAKSAKSGQSASTPLPCGCIGTCKCSLMKALLGNGVDYAMGLAGLSDADRVAAMKQRSCPVMGVRLGAVGTPVKATHNGRDIFLCCEMCREKFDSDPQMYIEKVDQMQLKLDAIDQMSSELKKNSKADEDNE